MSDSIGFSRPNFRDDPYPYYSQLRSHSPVHFFNEGFWAVSRHQDVVAALKQPDLFSSHTGMLESTPIGEDPPLHTKLRKAGHRILYALKLSVWENRIREMVDTYFEEVERRGAFELFTSIADRLPLTLILEILEIPLDNQALWFQWLNQPTRLPALENQLAQLPIWEAEAPYLSVEQRVRFGRLLLIAATETSRNLIGNATLALLKHPEQMELVRRDKRLLPQLVEEALRYDTPVQMIDRRAAQDVEIAGTHIPAGSSVFLLLGSANRDPDVFEDPDRFLVTRDASKHVGFGEGPHYCLGAQLARLETQIVLEALLFRLKGLKPAHPLEQVQYIDTLKVRGLIALHLTFEKS